MIGRIVEPTEEVALGGLPNDAVLGEKAAVEMAEVGGDECNGTTGERGGTVDPVVAIRTGHRLDDRLIVVGGHSTRREGPMAMGSLGNQP
ncbi:MAG: hypothetical protein ACR2G7_08850 [Acidimicrobiales bacterium]